MWIPTLSHGFRGPFGFVAEGAISTYCMLLVVMPVGRLVEISSKLRVAALPSNLSDFHEVVHHHQQHPN